MFGFNTQPPEGGWSTVCELGCGDTDVSTHSRPKAAGLDIKSRGLGVSVSTHSRLKAAGSTIRISWQPVGVSIHSRLKAAGHVMMRRRGLPDVSTHSRLKAAGIRNPERANANKCFNTQPPKGGWKGFGGRVG